MKSIKRREENRKKPDRHLDINIQIISNVILDVLTGRKELIRIKLLACYAGGDNNNSKTEISRLVATTKRSLRVLCACTATYARTQRHASSRFSAQASANHESRFGRLSKSSFRKFSKRIMFSRRAHACRALLSGNRAMVKLCWCNDMTR